MTARSLMPPAYVGVFVLAWTEGASLTMVGLGALLVLARMAGREARRGG